MLEADHRAQIERALGRALEASELVEVSGLNELSAAQRAIANELANKQLVLCALYLRSIASATMPETTRFIDSLQHQMPR
jgi:hypothetical protein